MKKYTKTQKVENMYYVNQRLLEKYHVFLDGLTKKRLKEIDKKFYCDDVTEFYGHNFNKSDIVGHLYLSVDDDLQYNLNLIKKVVNYFIENNYIYETFYLSSYIQEIENNKITSITWSFKND